MRAGRRRTAANIHRHLSVEKQAASEMSVEIRKESEMKSEWFVKVIIAFIFVVLIGTFVVGIASTVLNESNKISNGVIVDKWMDEGGTRYSSNKDGGHMYSYPPSYHFTIEGDKDGKTVEYSFSVSESDYNAYKIGDEYSR